MKPDFHKLLVEEAPDALIATSPDGKVLSWNRGAVCTFGDSQAEAVKTDPQLQGIPFMFITSNYRNEAARRKGLAPGAERFLLRPMDPQVLIEEIESCLRERREG
jgi:CheY-like chemotaxis protein